jgi:cytidylate kinase
MTRSVTAIVDEQLARWRAAHDAPVQVVGTERPRPDVVAISRELGTAAGAVARQTSELLRLPLFDHEIVEHIARTAQVHLETVMTLDEHAQSRVDEYLGALLHERNFDRSDYLTLLARTVVSLWEHGPCVLMGHGSVHLVPREHALKVRLVAPAEVRTEALAEERHLSAREATRQLARADAEQAAFHRRYFDASDRDPHDYDLTLDTGSLGATTSAELIARAYRQRFPRP